MHSAEPKCTTAAITTLLGTDISYKTKRTKATAYMQSYNIRGSREKERGKKATACSQSTSTSKLLHQSDSCLQFQVQTAHTLQEDTEIDLDASVETGRRKLIDASGAGTSLLSPGWLTELGRLYGGKSVDLIIFSSQPVLEFVSATE